MVISSAASVFTFDASYDTNLEHARSNTPISGAFLKAPDIVPDVAFESKASISDACI